MGQMVQGLVWLALSKVGAMEGSQAEKRYEPSCSQVPFCTCGGNSGGRGTMTGARDQGEDYSGPGE